MDVMALTPLIHEGELASFPLHSLLLIYEHSSSLHVTTPLELLGIHKKYPNSDPIAPATAPWLCIVHLFIQQMEQKQLERKSNNGNNLVPIWFQMSIIRLCSPQLHFLKKQSVHHGMTKRTSTWGTSICEAVILLWQLSGFLLTRWKVLVQIQFQMSIIRLCSPNYTIRRNSLYTMGWRTSTWGTCVSDAVILLWQPRGFLLSRWKVLLRCRSRCLKL